MKSNRAGSRLFLFCGILASVLKLQAQPAALPSPAMDDGFFAEGSALVSPATGISGEYGTWTVQYVVGRSGLATGGGLRVQLPDAWHAGARNSANRLQATDPQDEHYVSANTSRAEVKLKTIVEAERAEKLIKHAKESLDGRSERYVFVVRVIVEAGRLREGDVISVIYGDRRGGGPGMLGGAIATAPEPVLLAVDAAGQSRFKLLKNAPRVQLVSGVPTEMLFHAPSQAVRGQPVRLLISLLDKQFNPVTRGETVRLTAVTGQAEFPAEVEIPAGQGYAHLTIMPTANAVLRLQATGKSSGLAAVSNPMDVATTVPARALYWGDLHSHARHSWDGVGDDSFDYARFITGLDFYSLTDHGLSPVASGSTRGLSEKDWAEYNALTEKFHDPLQFVTLHAYECSFGRPYGHHIVYFRDQPGPLVFPDRTTLEEFWQMLAAGDALTIPHHTGKFPGGVDFAHHAPVFRRNFEIYSGHGLSELYQPGHPLSFERSKFTSDARSLKSPTHAQDVWQQGLLLSTIASSDDHRAQPGQPHYGLAAVRATALTRHEIFQALHDRHSYGTTGQKMVLEFHLNGVPMGQIAETSSEPALKIRALGTDRIEWVEVLKYQAPAGKFAVVQKWQPEALDFEITWRDPEHVPGAIYYVRLQQKELVRGLPAMAWSSPIWSRAGKGRP